MRKIIIFFFLYQIMFAAGVLAGDMREIEMTDGSIITGEVLSLAGGIYTIRSGSLGTIKIEESKIRAIRSKPSSDNAANSQSAGEVSKLQDKMMNDKEVMSMIQSLQNDPDFKKILEDPGIMKAVQAGDVTTLMANPQFMKLLNNAAVQDIQRKVK